MNRRRIAAAAACGILSAGLLAGAGCGLSDAGGRSASTQDLTEDYRGAVTEPRREAATAQGFRQAYMNVSVELLKSGREMSGDRDPSGQNILISPVSVIAALEMTRNGAAGETLSQMNETIYPGITPEEGQEGIFALKELLGGGNGDTVKIADSVWLHTGDVFVPDEGFLTKMAGYGAAIYGAPFDGDTCRDINRWVSRETDGQIDGILDEIPEDAMMYLINAVAFDAEWETPYKKHEVQDAIFREEGGTETTVSMMYSEEHTFLSGAGARGVKKPYKEGYSFVALLPEEGTEFSVWLEAFDGADLLEVLSDEKDLLVQTGIPKLESETDLELSAVLAGMGMPQAFDEEAADFSGLGSCSDGSNLFISRVIHGTKICVDEKGTKAGAATAVEMVTETAALEEERVVLDRPFLYAIVEDESGLPVFIGTVEHF